MTLDQILKEWEESDCAKEATATAVFCHLHGWKEYHGKTIPDFISDAFKSGQESMTNAEVNDIADAYRSGFEAGRNEVVKIIEGMKLDKDVFYDEIPLVDALSILIEKIKSNK
jgi:hypothetical protein